eukprot:CAMPEP_0115007926 /NCGR_PEP_ID=MMETSP0216-20121206/21558_1 /TAXON_ID=223996 /ORGANISM="Protocruzia adherens, Strain Boccale" /LENGTH=574 /DNA_ID=CAMNT_0002375137 /DNA_START=135 /DNA_END=1859 /DNA_ORIENTATION=+
MQYDDGESYSSLGEGGIPEDDPFLIYKATDEEIYLMGEQQRRLEERQKAVVEKQEIWDKRPIRMRNRAGLIKELDREIDDLIDSGSAAKNQKSHFGELVPIAEDGDFKDSDSHISEISDRTSQSGSSQLALPSSKKRKDGSASGTRRKDRGYEVEKRETIREYIEKKREILLVKMSVAAKKEETEKMKDEYMQDEESIKNSMKKCKDDFDRFQKFRDDLKSNAEAAKKEADEAAAKRATKVQEISQLNEQINQIRSNIEKCSERLQLYKRYKEFIDRLTPKLDLDDIYDSTKISREQSREKSRRGGRSSGGRNQESRESGGAGGGSGSTFLTEASASKKKTEEDEEPVIYFKKPAQFLELIRELEDKNLFLIQNRQEAEYNLDELTSTNEKEMVVLKKELDDDLNNIEALEKRVAAERRRYNDLTSYLQKNEADKEEEASTSEIYEKVKELYLQAYPGADASNQIPLIDMVTVVERKMEELIRKHDELCLEDADQVKAILKTKGKIRRQKRVSDKKNDKSLQDKSKKFQERANAPPYKKPHTKPVMWRSEPKEKARKVKKVTNEDDQKYKEYFE